MKEAGFLKMMVEKVKARRILEIGTFDGTSALAMAECLPADGELITCEINAGVAGVARRRARRHPDGHKIDVRIGPALETLQQLTGLFDLIFIDADTRNYVHYYHHAKALLSPTGVLLIDNMRASAMVLTVSVADASAAAIQEVTGEVASDANLHAVLMNVRDGVMVITRREKTESSKT